MIFQISAHCMACIQTPRTLGRLENISNVLDCYTEASMVGGKSYCRERTRNQSRFISFVPDMVHTNWRATMGASAGWVDP